MTGGTFDKEYDELTGRLFFRDTHVGEMLRLGRSRLDIAVETVMMIDSLDMDERPGGDRGALPRPRRSERSSSPTAPTRWSRRRGRSPAAASTDRTIVLTGAMVPYAFGSSDGLFNLGSALSFVQVLPPGVYIAMNGRHFPWDDSPQEPRAGVFERMTS